MYYLRSFSTILVDTQDSVSFGVFMLPYPEYILISPGTTVLLPHNNKFTHAANSACRIVEEKG